MRAIPEITLLFTALTLMLEDICANESSGYILALVIAVGQVSEAGAVLWSSRDVTANELC
jgi:hypothetical protein